MQYSLNEICLLPSTIPTNIESRSQVNPFDENGNLPIFVAPMTSVLNADNIEIFKQHKVIPIAPRNVDIPFSNKTWVAISLQEFEKTVKEGDFLDEDKVLIDIANGHIGKLYDLVRQAKEVWPNITIMVGNIAHPNMYLECCKAGVDYVRVGIGGGSVCSTSVQCGIHASHHWMIKEIKKNPEYRMPNRTKLIADGGINTLDKAIKCLAIGYDYVMMGKCFAQCEEACGETKKINCRKKYPEVAINSGVVKASLEELIGTFSLDDTSYSHDIPGTGQLMRKYYGMASEQGQIDISGGANKNPEGIETWVEVNNTLESFTKKFEAALRSTMSYVGAHNLEELRTKTQYDIMSIEEFKSYYK